MNIEKQFPEILKFLDSSNEYSNSAQEVYVNGERFLVITQAGEHDGGQICFKRTEDGWQLFDSDTVVDVMQPTNFRNMLAAGTAAATVCNPSSDEDHAKVAALMVEQVDRFSSAEGPDGGNLACVWAVRKMVFKALGRAITTTDGTAVFDPELQRCFGATSQFEEVPAGGIIISPTTETPSGRNIGHVGLLGPHTASLDDRLVYSNSSSRAVWKQNFTVGKWIQKYREDKHLKVRTYRLPNRTPLTS